MAKAYLPWLLFAIGCSLLGEELTASGTGYDTDSNTQAIAEEVAGATLKEFSEKKLGSNQIAITLIDLRNPEKPLHGAYRGQTPIYPASVIKLFYMMAAHQWLADEKIQDTDELQRAMRDMIVVSGNEPTHYIVDLLTFTTSGPELSPNEFELWVFKRNAVNRFFTAQGYTNINVNQKPWCEGPYGRERVFVGKNYENRNALTTDATARLMASIALEQAVSATGSKAMLKLMERQPFKQPNSDEQGTAYTGAGLPEGSKLWSKAGWTSTARHDAALVELPSGRRFILVTFTTGQSKERGIIPFVARSIIERLE